MPTASNPCPRILIIDNYDSYTFNLYQFITAYKGTTPVVLRNNQFGWDEFQKSILPYFDAIVISPGPGRPDNTEVIMINLKDFGICAKILQETTIPILGVCLGHQGLVSILGGKIVSAEPPMHGRLSGVFHNEQDIFKSIPSPFNAVRYHSLIASHEDLPAELEITAWSSGIDTPETTIMGLKHKTKPIWTVQFHPESICTEFGQKIIDNFCILVEQFSRNVMCVKEVGKSETNRFVLDANVIPRPLISVGLNKAKNFSAIIKQIPDFVDPEIVFASLYSQAANSFWLDSAKVESGSSRYSFMGGGTLGPEGYTLSFSLRSRILSKFTAEGQTIETLEKGEPFFTRLSRIMHDSQVADNPIHWLSKKSKDRIPFIGGLVGFIGYEMKSETLKFDNSEKDFHTLSSDSNSDSSFIFTDRIIAFDHLESKMYLICLVNDLDNNNLDKKMQFDWIDEIQFFLKDVTKKNIRKNEAAEILVHGSGKMKPTHDRKEYIRMIKESLDAINQGETYEVCLTTQMKTTIRQPHPHPYEMYTHLRARNAAPYASYMSFNGNFIVTSSSPERFLRIEAENLVSMRPIKGTLPVANSINFAGSTSMIQKENARRAYLLETNEKDRSENLMIVDLIRNDLNQISEPNSVEVPCLMKVETYSTVHQLVSTVVAKLRPDLTAVDAIMRSFPPGSMTGAPKLRTVQIIESLEKSPRGVYSGTIGYFSVCGLADFAVVIRTAIFDLNPRERDSENITQVSIGAGGAIVALSDPEMEYKEMILKADSVLPSFTHIYNEYL